MTNKIARVVERPTVLAICSVFLAHWAFRYTGIDVTTLFSNSSTSCVNYCAKQTTAIRVFDHNVGLFAKTDGSNSTLPVT